MGGVSTYNDFKRGACFPVRQKIMGIQMSHKIRHNFGFMYKSCAWRKI